VRRFASTWPAGAYRNHRILWPGTGGRFAPDQLDDLDRNRCNRELSQKWNVRRPIGRTFRAIFAQTCMSAMCMNAVRIYEEQKPKDAEKLRREMERQGQKSYLLGHGAVVIVPGRLIYATMSYKRWVDLSSLKVARRVGELAAQGMSVEDALSLISGELQEEQEA